jgi:transposase
MQRENRNLTRDECAQAVVLAEEGWSYRRIGERFGVSHTSVSRMVQRYRETGDYIRRVGQGRHRTTTPAQDRFLRVLTLRQRFVTTRMLQSQLENVEGIRISIETIRQRLRKDNLQPRIPVRGPAIPMNNRRTRLHFAREHHNWVVADWENVLWTDESRFCLYTCDRRVRVFRRPNERYAQCNFMNTTLFGGGSVMVWGGISLNARTELVVLNGNLNADRYITDILSQHVVPFAPHIGPNFLLMQDNARPHTARVVQNYLLDVGINTLNWPARSPDLNPIENVWDMLGRRVRGHPNRPNNLEELGELLVEIWNGLDQDDIRTLILSMNRRCEAVIRSRGGNTRY